MTGEIDVFIFYRTALLFFLGTYTLLLTTTTVVRLVGVLSGTHRSKELLRLYVAYQLLSVRLRPLAGELFQISLWLAALLVIWRLHKLV
jgi:hypothetical protein